MCVKAVCCLCMTFFEKQNNWLIRITLPSLPLTTTHKKSGIKLVTSVKLVISDFSFSSYHYIANIISSLGVKFGEHSCC